jgi:phosphate starvation-inducible PhoH-like protein
VLELDTANQHQLANLCGQLDAHLRLIEERLNVHIGNRGNLFEISGEHNAINLCARVIYALLEEAREITLTPEHVHLQLSAACADDELLNGTDKANSAPVIRTRKDNIKPRGQNQQNYVRAIREHDINFGIGPAGTGKTYLAVACAVEALIKEDVRRILLVRPAVEAGEKLGFLPGDLSQKVDPYLRPLYDALYEMLGFDAVHKMIERQIIEVAPLAYMRGRTLNDAFIILDEAQNTTREQMKMFLTRIGFGATAVITGDATQIDLPRGTASGLAHAIKVLGHIDAISFTYFQSKDVVRHPIVQTIIDAYDAYEHNQENPR